MPKAFGKIKKGMTEEEVQPIIADAYVLFTAELPQLKTAYKSWRVDAGTITVYFGAHRTILSVSESRFIRPPSLLDKLRRLLGI